MAEEARAHQCLLENTFFGGDKYLDAADPKWVEATPLTKEDWGAFLVGINQASTGRIVLSERPFAAAC